MLVQKNFYEPTPENTDDTIEELTIALEEGFVASGIPHYIHQDGTLRITFGGRRFAVRLMEEQS